jgi:hypothetical protein
MAKWQFEEMPATLVELDPTQRDQFNNDEVGLAEALVREVIQNSTDAPATESSQVKVRFSVRKLAGQQLAELRKLFDSLRPNLDACGVDLSPLDAPEATVLVIEDFGTKGLTGRTDVLDNDNFRNFWRRHGRSGKGGSSGGRWGLGKLVFSSSSLVRAFFGLTVRVGETLPLLMGQAVLRNHEVNGKRHPAHGFWFESRGRDQLQLPVADAVTIAAIADLGGVTRQLQPGLSIVVPYLNTGVTEHAIITAVLDNYYFPILAGSLVVEVGTTLIDRGTFHQVAQGNAGNRFPLSFVETVGARLKAEPTIISSLPLGKNGVTDRTFTADQLERMKEEFRSGHLIHVRVPVALRRVSGEEVSSYVDLFMQALPEGSKPFALFARGSITVPGETRYFSGVQAFGAMVARDRGIGEFLGDAENPAHTNWIASAEKLGERWKAPAPTVKAIRYSLRELYTLIADQVAREDRNALIDLFSLVDPARSSKGARKRTGKPVVVAPPREKAISIRARKGGFEIIGGPGAANWSFPRRIGIRVAYDTMVGNPFTAHSKYDFDLTKNDISIELKDATVDARSSYQLVASVSGPDFVISGTGFDSNRDIVVDARAP